MNKLTEQMLQKSGYNYPALAVMAQALVIIVAKECAAIAQANGNAETSAAIMDTFTKADPVAEISEE